ncbi:hypothetical protein [Hirschia baltica]|uniref:Uncharacterized protein n=1 Tax=Hirschia baltica (strain ATCC 49814 / DSM 5838 / IFAM 1418) TaxID=582402 RepID=C6XMJ2_HIRBI|nr:hypothetical protein [Hirschia baltica]ACT59906.1 hypothetical protein Hbal_2226 [Hirschia baltica ATCC 49814]
MINKNVWLCGALVAGLSVGACGNDSASDGVASAPAEQSSKQAPSSLSPENEEAEAKVDFSLTQAPLEREALFGLVSETVVETVPCPFLSDSTAIATAKTNHELLRREVSNELCLWSKNAGFSVQVSVEPKTSATPLQDRKYNLETPPVIKEQAGPGQNAAILYDTAWDKELAYAMGFEQDDKLVMIFITGMDTNAELLTATAEEIAAKLPTAPSIDKQMREIKPAIDFCSIWSDESIANLISADADSGLYSSAYGAAGCKWNAGYGTTAKSVTFARYKQGDTDLNRMLELGGEEIADLGDRAVILTRPANDSYAGDTALWAEIDDQQFNLMLSGTISDHDELALKLMENLFSRF